MFSTLLNGCKHLVTTLKQLMYLCKDHMASTHQKLVIPIIGYYNLSIPLLKHFIKGIWSQWNGIVEWNSGMEWWNGTKSRDPKTVLAIVGFIE